jgi:uncharacterized membrane protein YphA (DoxX/SURF4 family)
MKTQLTLKQTIVSWIAQLMAAVIMFQTLFFKFSGAEESVYIFETIGMEPWGRYATGVAEFIASALLLIPKLSWIGAGLGVGLMSGAILMHLTLLGISVQDDHGYLFILALTTFLSCILVLYIRRAQVYSLNKLV